MVEVKPNKYAQDLLSVFWYYRPVNEEDEKIYTLLRRIASANLDDKGFKDKEFIGAISLTDYELNILRQHNFLEHPNLELRMRCIDVMLRFEKEKSRVDLIRNLSDGYLKLYKETEIVFYFLRAMEVRVVKELYDDEFLSTFCDVVTSPIIHPGWMIKPLNRIRLNVKEGRSNPIFRKILSEYAKAALTKDAYWNDKYLDMLYRGGFIEISEFQFKKALNWEKYADSIELNKKEKVFNANLHSILHKAYLEINHVKDTKKEEYERIKHKYNTAKKDFIEVISSCGGRVEYEVSEAFIDLVCKEMSVLNLQSIHEALLSFLNLPFYSAYECIIERLITDCKKQENSVLDKLISGSQILDREGNVVGVSNNVEDRIRQVHKYVRHSLLYHIVCLFERVKEHTLNFSEKDFNELLLRYKPSFIEDDRVQIWAKAYNSYFSEDIVTASHLLMPQFERGLHNLLEELDGDVTQLQKKLQEEPTMIKIINLIKPYCNPTLHRDMRLFFVEGCDVNYRNKISHGLMSSMEILSYSHYLFYVSNLLFFKGKDFLKIGENKTD